MAWLTSSTLGDEPSTAPYAVSPEAENLIKAVEKLGKERSLEFVTYNSLHYPITVILPSTAPTEKNLQLLAQIPSLTSIKIFCAPDPIRADAMLSLSKLPKLRELIIRGYYPKLTEGVGTTLKSLRSLEVFEVRYASIDRGALDALATLPKLRSLRISAQSDLGDAEAASLQHFSNLEELNLSDTNVTDASLRYFASMPRLKHLVLSRTKITAAGISASQLSRHVQVEGVE